MLAPVPTSRFLARAACGRPGCGRQVLSSPGISHADATVCSATVPSGARSRHSRRMRKLSLEQGSAARQSVSTLSFRDLLTQCCSAARPSTEWIGRLSLGDEEILFTVP